MVEVTVERKEGVRSWLAAALFAGGRAGRLAHLHRRCACYCCLARARGLFPLLRRRAAHSARIAPTIFLPTRVTRAASRRGNGSCVFFLLASCGAHFAKRAFRLQQLFLELRPSRHLIFHPSTDASRHGPDVCRLLATTSSHQLHCLRCRSPAFG